MGVRADARAARAVRVFRHHATGGSGFGEIVSGAGIRSSPFCALGNSGMCSTSSLVCDLYAYASAL